MPANEPGGSRYHPAAEGRARPGVLAVLADADSYGYDVVRRLRENGLDHVGDASVYGTLRRLYQAGALSSYVVPSEEGPHRKYYSLTPSGTELVAGAAGRWRT